MDRDTVELAITILVGVGLVLMVLERIFRRRPRLSDVERRRAHAVTARKSTFVAGVFVVLLVLALFLGRPLLGIMSLAGIAVSVAVAAVRGRTSR